MGFLRWAMLLLILAGGLVSCKQVPTSILLRVEAEAALPSPDELRLAIFDEAGVAVPERRLPACEDPSCPPPSLPNEVVLYPPVESGRLRLLVRAMQGGVVSGEGTNQVEIRVGEQVQVTVVVKQGRLPDGDGDGVPDDIDNCPAWPNPDQGPCPSPDGGVDTGVDLPVDGPRDTGGDILRMDAPVDGPTTDVGCTCPLGCKTGTLDCRVLVPSGGYTASSYAKLPPVQTAATVDTTSCSLVAGGGSLQGSIQTGSSGGSACVLAVEAFTVTTAGTVTVTGDHPLVILANTSVTIDGLLDAGAKGTVPGPGGEEGGQAPTGGPGAAGDGPGGGKVCQCPQLDGDDCGGGGGGFGQAGATGGSEGGVCSSVSTGGQAYGSSTLVPLVGGSGGASAGQATLTDGVAAGGAGGGAVQISCGGTIQVQGAISAGGGGGQGLAAATPGEGGGGGGSGGGVLLEGASIVGSGLVAVNGGGGAASGATGCGGPGGAGEDGAANLLAAKGGVPAGSPCVAGGAGGSAAGPAQAGSDGTATAQSGGGGGGGGMGRIRLRWYNHAHTSPLKVSGQVSFSEVDAQ